MTKSAVSRAAFLLGRCPDDEDVDFDNPGVFAMSIRIPSPRASLLSAMADQAGISRNEMANLVVEAGIEAILDATPDEAKAEIYSEAEANISDFIS
jgi:hypothetical protein